MVRSVIVTGMGVVGVNVARRFVEGGYNVVFYDIAPRNRIQVDFLKETSEKITVVQGDIWDIPYLLETAKKYDVESIVHTAIMWPISHLYPDSVFRGTVEGTQNVLEVARLQDLKVTYLSSDAAYGPRHDMQPISEEDPTPKIWPKDDPLTIYILVKVCCENLMNAYNAIYGVDTVILRPAWIFGHADDHIYRPATYFAWAALHGETVSIPDCGGDHSLDYTYVKDLADGIFKSVTVRPIQHRVFNMTGGKLHSLYELAEGIMDVVPGSKIELGPGKMKDGDPLPQVRRELTLTQNYYHGPLVLARAKKELGYEVTPFKEAIRGYIDWLKRQTTPGGA